MKKIVSIILLNLLFNSCVKKEQIIGNLQIDKSARVLNLVLENKSDIWVATNLIKKGDKNAIEVLSELEKSNTIFSMNAKITLEMYKKGLV